MKVHPPTPSVWAACALLSSVACTNVHSYGTRTSAVAYPPTHGRVVVSAARDPEGATQVGTLRASGEHSIESLIPELVDRARELGGNYARIDRIDTRFENRVRMNPTSNCGSMRFPMTCGTAAYHTEEVPVLVIEGRAFRTADAPP